MEPETSSSLRNKPLLIQERMIAMIANATTPKTINAGVAAVRFFSAPTENGVSDESALCGALIVLAVS